MEYFIPKDTSKLFKSNKLQSKNIDNFSLRLNRYVREDLFSLKNEYEGVSFDTNIETDRVDRYYNILKLIPYEQSSLSIKNNWKLTLGMGSGSVYNTSMTLHHIYGVPYLPAQSIKGAFRSYIVQTYFADELFSEKYNKYSDFEEEVLYKTSWFVDIFGSNDQQGKVIFFDAFSKDFKIIKDIMTPHYKDYYGDNKNRVAPTDTQDPQPIKFLALQNASFEIYFASKENIEIEDGIFKGKKILELIKDELSVSLEIFGIGGKTAVGYGYFDIKKSQEEIDLEIILSSQKIQYIEEFKEKNPNHKFIEQIDKKLNEIKEEEKKKIEEAKIQEAKNKWESVLRVDKKYKEKALNDYINNYPNSPMLQEAKDELNKVAKTQTKQSSKGLDFSKAKDGKGIERVIKSIQNPSDEDKDKLEEAIKRVYPNLNAKKKKQFLRSSKLMVKWLGQDRFYRLLNA